MQNGQMTAMMMIECMEILKASMDPLCVVWRTSSKPLKLLNLENLMKLVSWLEPHISNMLFHNPQQMCKHIDSRGQPPTNGHNNKLAGEHIVD